MGQPHLVWGRGEKCGAFPVKLRPKQDEDAEPEQHQRQQRRDAVQEDEAEWAMAEAGVVGDDAVEAREEGGECALADEEDEREDGGGQVGEGGANDQQENAGVPRLPTPASKLAGDPGLRASRSARDDGFRDYRLTLDFVQGVESERELRERERQGGGFDGGGDAGEEAKGRSGPELALAHGEEEEGGGGEQADGHGEVALTAFGEAVAAVDEDEEAGSEEGGEGTHPFR